MLVGLGMDLTDIGRMERALQRHGARFAARILAPAEQEACPELRPAFVAGRWAAKEAAVKALGCGFSLGSHRDPAHADGQTGVALYRPGPGACPAAGRAPYPCIHHA